MHEHKGREASFSSRKRKHDYFHIDVLLPDYREKCLRVDPEIHRKWQAIVEGVASRLGVSLPCFPGAWRKRGKSGLTLAQAGGAKIVEKITRWLSRCLVSFEPKANMVWYWLMEKPTSQVFAAFKSVCESLGFEHIDWTEPISMQISMCDQLSV